MRPIIFFHPCNDYTGSTRVLSNVISEKYYNEEVVIVTEKNGNKGFLSEHKNVRIINVLNPKLCGKSIPVLSSFVWRFCATFITILVGWKYKTFYINTLIPYYAALIGRFMGKTRCREDKCRFGFRPDIATQSLGRWLLPSRLYP
mgnify:CR=1 FL=1